jgi:hypothetical protein
LHWFPRRNNVAAMYAVLWASAEVDPIGGEWDYDSDGLGTFSRRNNVAAMSAVLWASAEVDPIGDEWDYDSDGLGTGPPTVVGGRTLLHEAAQHGNVEAISVLMEFGTNLSLCDDTTYENCFAHCGGGEEGQRGETVGGLLA